MGRKNAKVKRNTKFGLTTAEVTVCCGQAHSEHRHEAVLAVSPLCSHPGKLSFGGTGKEHCLPVCCHCHHLLWRSSKSVTVVTSCAAQRCPPAVPAHCSAQKPPPVVFRSAQHNGDSPRGWHDVWDKGFPCCTGAESPRGTALYWGTSAEKSFQVEKFLHRY